MPTIITGNMNKRPFAAVAVDFALDVPVGRDLFGKAGIEPGGGARGERTIRNRDDPVNAGHAVVSFRVLEPEMVPKPRQHILEHRRIEGVVNLLPVATAPDQVGLLENRKMVRHRRLGHIERRRQLARGLLAPRQQPQDLAPGRVRQRLENRR